MRAKNRWPLATALWLVPLAGACTTTPEIATPRTAFQQVLATEAIDRALAQIEWPEVEGRTVVVELGTPGDAIDHRYLRRAVEVAIAARGAEVVADREAQPAFAVEVLVGAIGLDVQGRMLGIEGTESGFLVPFTIRELSLYKRIDYEGFAKLEIALLDLTSGGVVHRSGPVQGGTWRRETTYLLFFRRDQTDTSRLE